MKLQFLTFLQRFYFPWTFSRVMFSVFGLIILGQGIYDHQWLAVLVGVYFLLSGVFSLGCVGGNCPVPTNNSVIQED